MTLSLLLTHVGCDRDGELEGEPVASSGAAASAKSVALSAGPPAATSASASPEQEPAEEKVAELTCPPGMKLLPAGAFWVGAEYESYDREENPRFRMKMAAFCFDETEVTEAAYRACVDDGKCGRPHTAYKTCNFERKGREDHPINCIDHAQATTYCESRGARLPTEFEWEYAARGGEEMRKYPWGDAAPDGHTCWKHHGTCQVKSFEAGAFGLYDVTGNVWEWTSDWFGRYPWPAVDGRHRVYRGGSWSRRFEKWMRPTLRNRFDPDKWGSHLGVRCALTPESVQCPYGRTKDGQSCRHGIEEVQCLDGQEWNGHRCAAPGETGCGDGAHEEPGHGCVRERVAGSAAHELDTASVKRTRSPNFDADCLANSPGRPHAYRYVGGGHLARNVVGKNDGCKNRDVGVGWNSACCP